MDQAYGDRSVATTDRTIIAMFDDAAAASRAITALESAGVPRASISTHQAETGGTAPARANDDDSWWESIKRLFMPDEDAHTYREGIRRGGVMLVVHVEAARNDVAIDALEHAGAVDIDQRADQWRSEGWTPGAQVQAAAPGPAPAATGATTAGRATAGPGNVEASATETRIPIAREELRIGKRDVSAGHVRVRAYTVSRPVHETVGLRHETVEVERRPASGSAVTTDGDPFRERTVDVEETREEAVVSKEARVDEELVVRKRAEQEQRDVSDTVRETRVEVEDERAGTPAAPKPR